LRKFFTAFTGVLVGLTVLLGVPTAAMASGARHVYAGVAQGFSGTDYVKGVSANVYVAKPFVDSDSAFSLMELAAVDTGNGREAIEVGWAVYPAIFGNNNPHLFVCSWDNAGHSMPGCWTGTSASGPTGWVDNSSNSINIGADLGTVAAACNGSSLACVKKFEIKFVSGINACSFSANGWEVWYDNAKVACWRGNAWSTAGYPVMTKANELQAFAEVAYGSTGNPKTDLGNGQYGDGAALGNTGPAFFGSLNISGQNPSTLVPHFDYINEPEPSAYKVGVQTANPPVTPTTCNPDGSRSYCTYGVGGPGYALVNGVWTTPGDIGS
jgi:hypothetical protein